jgi:hypothetical protein
MSEIIINSADSLSTAFGDIRQQYEQHHFVILNVKAGVDRSLPQNSIGHAWYGQLARELREYDALGWKCFCKLNYGVPILRAEDAEFREFYDLSIKHTLSYEQKIAAMKFMPVTSLMTKAQKSKYLETVQAAFAQKVRLEFPVHSDMREAA